MKILTKLQSLNMQRNLSHASGNTTRTLQRLSSGLRVNSARDDAAGLAIWSRMQTRQQILTQSATTVLAQTNSALNLALTLLRNF